MRSLTAALLGASMLVALPALAQEAPAIPAPVAVPVPAPWGYGPYPYAAPLPWWRSPLGPAVTERRSNGLRITGITLFALGGAVNVVGGGILALGLTTSCQGLVALGGLGGSHGLPPSPHRARPRERVGSAQQALGRCGDDTVPIGAGVMAAGLLGSFVGIPLLLIGNARVRARPQDAAAPELRVGAGGADLLWQF